MAKKLGIVLRTVLLVNCIFEVELHSISKIMEIIIEYGEANSYGLGKEDENSSDEEYVHRRPRTICGRAQYFEEYDDVDFFIRFRLTKPTVLHILDLIEDQLEFSSDKNHAVSPVNQLLCALRYYATGCSQLSSGDFGGFSQPTANRIIHRVSLAIARLRNQFIQFPENPQDIKKAQLEFYQIARFPKAIGAMDCTHIRLKSPGGEDAELFRNRKGYFSINVQAICNANLEFTDIVARWPGSPHDSTIFNNCNRRAHFEAGRNGDAILLVDGGYPNKPYLMPPVEGPVTPAEILYNESQIRSRNPIERMFGVWKRRFPCLAVGFQIGMDRARTVIVATAVLHNIARQAGEPYPIDDPTLELPLPWEDLAGPEQREMRPGQRRGAEDRVPRLLIDNYFQALV